MKILLGDYHGYPSTAAVHCEWDQEDVAYEAFQRKVGVEVAFIRAQDFLF